MSEVSEMERTLSIIKPDAVSRGLEGEVNALLEAGGLRVVARRGLRLTEDQAREFYAVHRERPFYGDLVRYMTSGDVVVQVLEGEGAVLRNREIMGATDPAEAGEGTIRRLFGESIERNVVHGSDSLENARVEIAFFFGDAELK